MISWDLLPANICTIRPRPKRASQPAAVRRDIRATPLSALRTVISSSGVGARDSPEPSSRQTSQFPQTPASSSPKYIRIHFCRHTRE
jgi:hypothetical protein